VSAAVLRTRHWGASTLAFIYASHKETNKQTKTWFGSRLFKVVEGGRGESGRGDMKGGGNQGGGDVTGVAWLYKARPLQCTGTAAPPSTSFFYFFATSFFYFFELVQGDWKGRKIGKKRYAKSQ
jgi:hypothetical protein